jgi:hypothetical protein
MDVMLASIVVKDNAALHSYSPDDSAQIGLPTQIIVKRLFFV